MTVYSNDLVHRTYKTKLPSCANDHECAVEATADMLGIANADVEKAVAEAKASAAECAAC